MQQTKNNKQKTTNNKQQTTNNKPQTTNKKNNPPSNANLFIALIFYFSEADTTTIRSKCKKKAHLYYL